jgi:hypothetical protein
VIDAENDLALHGEHRKRVLQRHEQPLQVHASDIELAATRFETADVEQALYQSCQRIRLFLQCRQDLALLG